MFKAGVADSAPLAFGGAAWGLVTGVAMAKSGIGIPLALMMSLMVSAGSSQIAAVPLIVGGAPMWVVWATVACVNLRFLVFSYQYRPYFAHLPRATRIRLGYFMGDTIFAAFVHRYPEPRREPGQLDYFWGAGLVNWAAWQLGGVTGILAGSAIPPEWGIGFAGSMALLALGCSLLRTRATWIAAGVAACAAVAVYGLPFRLNIVVAISAAVAAGLLAQRMLPPRRTP